MTTAQFQSWHIERHAWLSALTAYDALYHAFYSVWARHVTLSTASLPRTIRDDIRDSL